MTLDKYSDNIIIPFILSTMVCFIFLSCISIIYMLIVFFPEIIYFHFSMFVMFYCFFFIITIKQGWGINHTKKCTIEESG